MRRRSSSRGGGGRVKMIVLFALAVAAFFAGMAWFRQQTPNIVEAEPTNGSSVVTLNPADEAPIRRNREEATLYNVDGVGLAVASREVQDHIFHHTVVAHLSDLPDGIHYQGWLVRDEPFDFFTTGSMEKNADGTYALVWDGALGKDFQDYNQVVITQEVDGGDAGPSLHVLEGKFE